ncbi:MAG: hypothetical protein LLF99_12180, partial [Desulfobacteraceae bacterium]|nr:hypothetical protein [Desulfobacteraceae bacterium]
MNGLNRAKPIFFDPANKRWPRLRFGMALAALIFTLVLGTLALGILAGPALPTLSMPRVSFLQHGIHSVPNIPHLSPARPLTRRERALKKTKAKLAKERERNFRQLLAEAYKMPPGLTHRQLAVGYLVNWDDSSMGSLKQNLDSLDMVIPEWLHLAEENGSVREDDPDRQAQATDYIRLLRPDFPIMPLVNNWNGKEWEGAKLGRMLASPAARKATVEHLLSYVERWRFAGVSIDFENIPAKAQGNFQRFMAELYDAFQPRGLLVSVNVPADDPAFDYRALTRKADYVILMLYDEHWATGKPGPIAGLPWFADALRRRQIDVPAEKMIAAIGNYAYDWATGRDAEERTFEEAVLTAKESEANIHLDSASLNPTFDYSDDDDILHHVWILDAVSAFNQLVLTGPVRPGGIALWRLGSEDPSLWRIFGKKVPPNAEISAQLQDVQLGYGLEYEGSGEILQISDRPRPGRREIVFDAKRNLITAEQFTEFPSPYVITRHGGAARKLALTFDDGPDKRFTPQILDALNRA